MSNTDQDPRDAFEKFMVNAGNVTNWQVWMAGYLWAASRAAPSAARQAEPLYAEQLAREHGTVICENGPDAQLEFSFRLHEVEALILDVLLHPETGAARQAEARDALREVESLLTNLQPIIPQACYPGREKFIDNYIDPALEILRAALSSQEGEACE